MTDIKIITAQRGKPAKVQLENPIRLTERENTDTFFLDNGLSVSVYLMGTSPDYSNHIMVSRDGVELAESFVYEGEHWSDAALAEAQAHAIERALNEACAILYLSERYAFNSSTTGYQRNEIGSNGRTYIEFDTVDYKSVNVRLCVDDHIVSESSSSVPDGENLVDVANKLLLSVLREEQVSAVSESLKFDVGTLKDQVAALDELSSALLSCHHKD